MCACCVCLREFKLAFAGRSEGGWEALKNCMNGVGDGGGVLEMGMVGAVREAWVGVEVEVEGVGASLWLAASDGELSLPRM